MRMDLCNMIIVLFSSVSIIISTVQVTFLLQVPNCTLSRTLCCIFLLWLRFPNKLKNHIWGLFYLQRHLASESKNGNRIPDVMLKRKFLQNNNKGSESFYVAWYEVNCLMPEYWRIKEKIKGEYQQTRLQKSR